MINLEDFFQYYKATPNQTKAIEMLAKEMPIELLGDDSPWVLQYRTADAAADLGSIPQQGVDLCHSFEGCRLAPYLCPAGVPTIGWGNTRYEDGVAVKLTDPAIDQERADVLFVNISEKDFWNIIKTTIPYWGEMNDNQRSALFDFSYNLGARFFNSAGFGTISRELANHNWQAVPDALMLYCNPGTAYEAGLKRRRAAEGDLWCKPI